MLTVFGIRHHGPGSAKSLKKALNDLAPDCILIECPADAEKMLSFVGNENLKPPVALLIYNPKLLTQAAYIPFADFSPEWQAMKYAIKRDIPIRCMDLPMNLTFTINQQEAEKKQLKFETNNQLTSHDKTFRKDPLGYMAEIAGYSDSERWWEVTFESAENETEIFASILEMMTALRQEEIRKESTETLRREAYMRKVIRKAIKDGFDNIAIVCGAWHSPVLHNVAHYKQSTDNAILKGIKKTSTKATWVPWSYDRLTYLSGYGAGVLSPAWYELLFSNRKETTMRWMTKVARLFRKKDLDASAAHVIEAVRLANTLATLRGLSVPGIEEMKEAAVSIICEGDESQLQLIEKQLIIGKKVGNVPPEIPVIPLQQDLEKTIKSARLSSYWKNTEELWLKANASNPRGGIDLREEKDLLKSHLLHRLNLLGLHWGKLQKEGRYDLGSFKEYWKLKWKAEFSIRIIEAGMWGNTVYEASVNFVKKQLPDIEQLPEVTALVEQALNANLEDAIDDLIAHLQNLAAVTQDVYHLMDALPSLVNIVRYGNARKTDIQLVSQVVERIIPRICIALPGVCVSLDEDASEVVFQKLMSTHRALSLLNDTQHNNAWLQTLKNIAQMKKVNGRLNGVCTRLLFDKGLFDINLTTTQMRYHLSKGNDTLHAAAWIEGFLYGSGLLLIHNPSLWNILDEWIEEMEWLDFKAIVPLLRRTFSQFPAGEKAKMMELAKHGQMTETTVVNHKQEYDLERAERVLPVVQLLLGIE
jgi:hypothetical protein